MFWQVFLIILGVSALLNAGLSWWLLPHWPNLYKWKWLIELVGMRRAILIRSLYCTLIGLLLLWWSMVL